jgi:hypothetical protein
VGTGDRSHPVAEREHVSGKGDSDGVSGGDAGDFDVDGGDRAGSVEPVYGAGETYERARPIGWDLFGAARRDQGCDRPRQVIAEGPARPAVRT